jgi:molecular chaperone GrpE (heat shock protein)
MSNRREYEQRVKARFEELEAEIEVLRKHVLDAEAELGPEHHRRVLELQQLKETAKEKMHELLDASDDAWESLQGGMEHYYTALGNELKAFDGFVNR